MKKIIFATLFIGFAICSKAQGYTLENVFVSSITVKEGQNSILTKHGKGTLQFIKAGERISRVVFLDSLGRSHALTAIPANTTGAPKPDCNSALPDACFESANKQYGLCVCKPDKLGAADMTFMTYTGADRYSIKNFKLGQYK